MNIKENSEPGIGLSFTRPMPLSWRHLKSHAGGYDEEAERMRNERLLQLLLLYDEYPNEHRDEDGENSTDLERVEAKLDAVIHLLAFLIAERGGSSSSSRPVTVSAHHLEWVDGRVTAPAPGERLWVFLEIDPRLPQSLKMAAHVVQLIPDGTDGMKVRVALEDQGERVQQALEKFIFRIHRREIARMRSEEHS